MSSVRSTVVLYSDFYMCVCNSVNIVFYIIHARYSEVYAHRMQNSCFHSSWIHETVTCILEVQVYNLFFVFIVRIVDIRRFSDI
jgi:hypothetical protein